MNLNGKATNPGELRTPVTLQSPTLTADAGGAQVPGWATLKAVYAKWTNVHGGEVWASQAAQVIEPATVLVRYNASLNSACAVLLGTKRYKIISIDDIQNRHEYQELKVSLMEGTL
jgi:SPP1 family predicted phage head-tail adaptor